MHFFGMLVFVCAGNLLKICNMTKTIYPIIIFIFLFLFHHGLIIIVVIISKFCLYIIIFKYISF